MIPSMSNPATREGQPASEPNEVVVKTLGAKAVTVDAEKQSGTAIVASLGEIDLHDDIILPGALENPGERIPVLDSHGWADTSRYGVATLKEADGKIVAEFKLFATTDKGKHFYEALKEMGEDQEWSVGIRLIETAWVVRDSAEYREIRKMVVDEISAVTRGAQPGTATTSIKTARDLADLRSKVESQASEIEALKATKDADPANAGDPAPTGGDPAAGEPTDGDPPEVAGVPATLKEIRDLAGSVKSLAENLSTVLETMGEKYGKALEALTDAAKALGEIAEKGVAAPTAPTAPPANDPPAAPPASEPSGDPDPETPERKALRERLERNVSHLLR